MLVNADTRESLQLLNDRMAYVAVSRAGQEALIYTDSAANLPDRVNRGTDKDMALKAMKGTLRDVQKERDPATHNPLAPQSQKQSIIWTTAQPKLIQHRRRPQSLPLKPSKPNSAQPCCFRTNLST